MRPPKAEGLELWANMSVGPVVEDIWKLVNFLAPVIEASLRAQPRDIRGFKIFTVFPATCNHVIPKINHSDTGAWREQAERRLSPIQLGIRIS